LSPRRNPPESIHATIGVCHALPRMSHPAFMESYRVLIEEHLDGLLPSEDTPPVSIHKAMRYSVLQGGKRIRPALCLEAAHLFTEKLEPVVPVACGIEFIHCYSLIHDDLPALDNDDLRRGRPTCHRVFGVAHAILAGDALLTLAFQALAQAPIDPARRVRILSEVAVAAGTVGGMVGGQVADIEAEDKALDGATLEYIHRSKTAALICAAAVAGAIGGGGTDADVERIRRYGQNIGWAFQVVDDILDVEQSSQALGKTAGKDAAQKKATYPALYGIEKSRKIAADLLAKAVSEIECYGNRAEGLRQLAEFLIARQA
jgi:geranylgeranyl diphosphate synthase, type II